MLKCLVKRNISEYVYVHLCPSFDLIQDTSTWNMTNLIIHIPVYTVYDHNSIEISDHLSSV